MGRGTAEYVYLCSCCCCATNIAREKAVKFNWLANCPGGVATLKSEKESSFSRYIFLPLSSFSYAFHNKLLQIKALCGYVRVCQKLSSRRFRKSWHYKPPPIKTICRNKQVAKCQRGLRKVRAFSNADVDANAKSCAEKMLGRVTKKLLR